MDPSRETLIALRASRTAHRVASDIAYDPPIRRAAPVVRVRENEDLEYARPELLSEGRRLRLIDWAVLVILGLCFLFSGLLVLVMLLFQRW